MPTKEEQEALFQAAQDMPPDPPKKGKKPKKPKKGDTGTSPPDTSNLNSVSMFADKDGNLPEIDHRTRAGRKEIRRRRKILRKAMKTQGIKSRREFENTAREMGLVLDNGWLAFWLNWWALKKAALLSSLGLKTLLLGAGAVLSAMFIAASVTEQAGSFTINLTADMLDFGFVLSETEDFEEPSSRLFSLELEQVNNITVADIDSQVYTGEGAEMNGLNYIGYSFYIRNDGDEASSYIYSLEMPSETLGVGEVVWVMMFEDGKQIIYARESADGDPEELYGYRVPPFYDQAYYPQSQYYEEDGRYGLITTPFDSDDMVEEGFVDMVEPGEVKKYTVVIWIEGNDPECTNDIFGGYAKLSMNFSQVEEEDKDSIFDGVFRTEYEDYITNHYDMDGE